MDHDQLLKTVIQTLFREFLELFFKEWADLLDFDRLEWLDKEVFPEPPDGARKVVDLLAKVGAREPIDGAKELLALVHVEIEGEDRAAPLRRRMPYYFFQLRAKYGLPVLPIAIYLKVGLDGIGVDVYEERFGKLCTVRFEYLYVGLPKLEAERYIEGGGALGAALSALMRVPKDRVAELGAEALRTIVDSPYTDQVKYLLGECVDAYMPWDDEDRERLKGILQTETYGGVRAMNVTMTQKAKYQGINEGRLEGRQQGLMEGRMEGAIQLIDPILREKYGHQADGFIEELRKVTELSVIQQVNRGLVLGQGIEELRQLLK